MNSGKAVGTDDIRIEAWKCLGEVGIQWHSIEVPIYKNKGDIQNCSNYRGIKLMSHIMKIWERVIELRLKSLTNLHMAFIDLEKAYDRVPSELIWWVLGRKKVSQCYVDIIKDMYEDTVTSVRSVGGMSNEFSRY
ncbi:hypothetical protein UlMin_012645 [Ulmus minor]